jgi:hypothetical protein
MVTLDPDVEALLITTMRERRLSFNEALNQAVRTGLAAREPITQFRSPGHRLGEPAVPIDKALRLAAELEDVELLRKLSSPDGPVER